MGNNFVDYSNATAIVTKIGQKIAALQGAFIYKGSVAFSGLPATLTAAMNGYVYNLNEQFTTDSRFVEGAGKVYAAGTNVTVVDTDGAGTMMFDVAASFVDVSGIEDRIDDVLANFAPEFDAANSYNAGDFVTYEDVVYRFDSDHSAGAWTGSDATAATVASLVAALETSIGVVDGKVDDVDDRVDDIVADLADEFSTATAYASGDVVMYQDTLYKFNATHAAGAWVGTDADEITVADLIDAAQAAATAAAGAAAAVDDRVDGVEASIADEFAAANAYSVGDYVIHEDTLYKFKAAHTAGDAWSSSEVDAVQITDLIEAAEPDSLTAAQEAALLALLD